MLPGGCDGYLQLGSQGSCCSFFESFEFVVKLDNANTVDVYLDAHVYLNLAGFTANIRLPTKTLLPESSKRVLLDVFCIGLPVDR